MPQSFVDMLHGVISSPWVYLALFALALLDGFFPIVPSETFVIAAGVFAAATGVPNLALVIAVVALGAFLGDHVSYAIGRTTRNRLRHGKRTARAFAWRRTASPNAAASS